MMIKTIDNLWQQNELMTANIMKVNLYENTMTQFINVNPKWQVDTSPLWLYNMGQWKYKLCWRPYRKAEFTIVYSH
jgi:hypothetical protein